LAETTPGNYTAHLRTSCFIIMFLLYLVKTINDFYGMQCSI